MKTMGWKEVEALSPLLIVLLGIILLLIQEIVAPEKKKRGSFWVASSTLLCGFLATFFAKGVNHPLLDPWIRFDSFSHFFLPFFLAFGLGIVLIAESFFRRFEVQRAEFYILLLCAILGLLLIALAADFLTLFIGLETLSIASYLLSGYVKKWQGCGESAIKYFVMGSIATAFFLYGIALFYGAFETTALFGEKQAFASSANSYLAAAALAFILVGLCFKAALVPFHLWAPDVYAGAPHPVTAFMAVGTKAGVFAALGKLFLITFPLLDFSLLALLEKALVALVAISLVYANTVALVQSEVRRFLAYSGISHAAFLFFPLLAVGAEAAFSLQFYLVIYSLATLAVFAVLAPLDKEEKGVLFSDLEGLFWRSPLLASILSLALLTLAGVPLTAGFLAKLYLFKVAFQAGYVALVFLALIVTVLAIFYYTRIVSLLFCKSEKEKQALAHSWPSLLVGVLSGFALLFFSIYPEILMR